MRAKVELPRVEIKRAQYKQTLALRGERASIEGEQHVIDLSEGFSNAQRQREGKNGFIRAPNASICGYMLDSNQLGYNFEPGKRTGGIWE